MFAADLEHLDVARGETRIPVARIEVVAARVQPQPHGKEVAQVVGVGAE